MITSLAIATLAFLITLGMTPLAGMAARRLNMMDHPDMHLKRHKQPVPYLGGAAVYLGFLLSLLTFKIWESSSVIGVVGVVSGTTLITLLGLIDDKARLSPAIKFCGQALAAGTLVACNMHVQFIHHPL
ncbi:undecaprenyl/decaprenyl-phosphate alpha-N-acetylglucosaminyl 1-phosphate transferase, partial [candidate division FCPU426 bacterium]|nr:undecaprenyl/decaprenyl-phosphate alpha-N-acetylglucosaminyl 1-phosphate transferase [candidate division FCPU426 bacterium]